MVKVAIVDVDESVPFDKVTKLVEHSVSDYFLKLSEECWLVIDYEGTVVDTASAKDVRRRYEDGHLDVTAKDFELLW